MPGRATGLYYTPVNSYLTADELAYIVDNSESKVLVTSSAKRDVAIAAAADCPRLTHILVVGDDGTSGDPRVVDYESAVSDQPATPARR